MSKSYFSLSFFFNKRKVKNSLIYHIVKLNDFKIEFNDKILTYVTMPINN